MNTMHKMFVGRYTVEDVVLTLTKASCWFAVEPYPDDEWMVQVRTENIGLLNRIWRQHNSLIEGMACPECGHDETFIIKAPAATVIVQSDHVAIHNDDVDWDTTSECICPSCNYHALVFDFKRRNSNG